MTSDNDADVPYPFADVDLRELAPPMDPPEPLMDRLNELLTRLAVAEARVRELEHDNRVLETSNAILRQIIRDRKGPSDAL